MDKEEDPRACRTVDFIKELHARTRAQLEHRAEQYARQANKGRQAASFEPGDYVWVHLRKERFLANRRSKLAPRGDGPFKVLEKFGANAYRVELPDSYGVHPTFNVGDLSLYIPFELDDDGDEARTLRSQEGESDSEGVLKTAQEEEALEVRSEGPITRA